MISLTFTGVQRVKTGLFYKSNSICFMYTWFIYVAMEHWILPRQSHVVFVIFTIWFVPITLVRRPSLGKFVYGLAEILFIGISHKSLYKTHSLPMSSFGSARIGSAWYHGSVVFSNAPTKCTVFARPMTHPMGVGKGGKVRPWSRLDFEIFCKKRLFS